MKLKQNKRSQAELITTVLLILVAIAAIVLVATFIINLIKTQLRGTECFQTAGQLSINLDESSYFDSSKNIVYVSIERGEKDFNLTGISITVGSESATKSFIAKPSDGSSEVKLKGGGSVTLPGVSETRTYQVNVSKTINELGTVTKVKIVPIIVGDKFCTEGSDEKNIPTR